MNQKIVILSIVLMLFCLQPAKSERWSGNILYDLEGQGTTFTTQANQWTVSTLKNTATRVYTCDGNALLGGYNILATGTGKYFERTFGSLPPHNQITFYMEFYALDSWDKDDNDRFTIRFDSQTIDGWAIPVYGGTSLGLSDICGSGLYNDAGLIKTYITIPHNLTSVTLRITSYLSEGSDNESFGFRNISFIFDLVDTPTNTFCGSTLFALPNNWCSCPSTQYMSPAKSGNCIDCHTSCLSCTGSGSNQCTACKDGTYLSGTRCYACDNSCATCSGGNANQCKTCKTGDYLVNNNTCVSTCPLPFYNTSSAITDFCETPCPGNFAYRNGICGNNCVLPNQTYTLVTLKACFCYAAGATASGPCYPCDSSCATCDGTAANECRSCDDGFYVAKRSGLSIGTCEPCISPCVTCTGPANNQCTSCIDGTYLSGTRCLPCDNSCATCSGGNTNQCKTCKTGDYLVNNNTCVSTCPLPFYNTSSAITAFCETPCPGNFAYRNGICGNNCVLPNQTYTLVTLKACFCYAAGATASGPCYPCDSSCATCDGTAANECRSCYDGFYVAKRTGLSIGTCEPCNSPCVTCSGPATNQCNSCEDGLYLSGGSCLPCGPTCATCTGGNSNQCKTCHPGDYLVGNNTCVPICPKPFYSTSNGVIDFCETPCPSNFAFKNGSCDGTCPIPPFQTYTLAILKACVCYSANATASDRCYSCDASCATCNGTAANECFTCSDRSYLKNTTGLTIGTCESCDSTCATCYGGAANKCNSCFPDAFLVNNGSAYNGTCGKCHSSCLTCNGPASTNCLSCPDRFYLAQNSLLAIDGACLPCHPTCATCSGPAIDECITCIEPGECPKIFFHVSNSEASSGMIILGFIIGGTTSLMIIAYLISKYKMARAKAKMVKKPLSNRVGRILPLPHSPSTSPLRKPRFSEDRKPTGDSSEMMV